MSSFKRSDLLFKDYVWKATNGDNPKITGFPDSKELNRTEGYEVVDFINRFIDGQQSWKEQNSAKKIELGQKIEKLIHDKLPGNIRSHAKVHSWIVENWDR